MTKANGFWIKNGWAPVNCSTCCVDIGWHEKKIMHAGKFFHFDRKCFDEGKMHLDYIGLVHTEKGKVAEVYTLIE